MAHFYDKLVTGKELLGQKKARSNKFMYEKFEPELRSKKEGEGWILDKELKHSVRMKKYKPVDEQFEDEVWSLFATLGFQFLNKDRHLEINYGSRGTGTTKQIDVFAVDDETVLFIECKCSPTGKKGDFKKDIESINGIKPGLFAEVRKIFPNRKMKFILATKNYEVVDNDKARMKDLGIQHFDEYAVSYFYELSKHLGTSARYQLLGTLFDGQKINSMDNKIPAIEGKMGGHTYYSFSIEPEKLLKISYVLHRNEANSDMMPTYQRIIKRSRLNEIQKFVNNGGFFPNSLIISIDTTNKKLPRFDPSSNQVENSISRIGILHLPQRYRSAYIIDGQHRLYGYADSKYAESNSIPVVAFVNLSKQTQVNLFMEINENQKSISKNLKNTLNADLLWDSEDWNKQRQALRLAIAHKLGETPSSPLFNRVLIGESESTPTKLITTDTIEKALKSTDFLSKYVKGNVIVENGSFDKGSNSATLKTLYPFIADCFNFFKENNHEEWEQGDNNQGVLTINNSIYALIKIFDDIINLLIEKKTINPKLDLSTDIIDQMEYYFAPLANFFNSVTEDKRKEIRTNYGSGGKTRVWRLFQSVISEARPDFQPEGLSQWIKDNTKQFNFESYEMLHDIEEIIKSDFAEKLKGKYGEKWMTAGLPAKVYKQANAIYANKTYESETSKEITLWDCVSIADCKNIATFGSNWSDLFESSYTRPNELKLSGGKVAKTEWISRLARISKSRSTNYSVTEDEYLFLKELHGWLLSKVTTNQTLNSRSAI